MYVMAAVLERMAKTINNSKLSAIRVVQLDTNHLNASLRGVIKQNGVLLVDRSRIPTVHAERTIIITLLLNL